MHTFFPEFLLKYYLVRNISKLLIFLFECYGYYKRDNPNVLHLQFNNIRAMSLLRVRMQYTCPIQCPSIILELMFLERLKTFRNIDFVGSNC